MSADFTLQDFARLVSENDGRVIVASDTRKKIGEPETMKYARDEFDPGFEVRQVAVREASREEYLAFPWPDGNDAPGPYFYEIHFD